MQEDILLISKFLKEFEKNIYYNLINNIKRFSGVYNGVNLTIIFIIFNVLIKKMFILIKQTFLN